MWSQHQSLGLENSLSTNDGVLGLGVCSLDLSISLVLLVLVLSRSFVVASYSHNGRSRTPQFFLAKLLKDATILLTNTIAACVLVIIIIIFFNKH